MIEMIHFFIDAALKLLQDPGLHNLVFPTVSGILVSFISFVFVATQRRRGRIAHTHIVTRGPKPFDMIIWKIWNGGKNAIEEADYRVNPIKFTFGNSASIGGAEIIKSLVSLNAPTFTGNRCELAPVFLDKGHSITLKFLVKDADARTTKVDLLVVDRDTIDMIKRAVRFLKITLVLLVLWAPIFAIHLKFPQLPLIYDISVGLAFLISSFGTLSVIYLFPAFPLFFVK